MSQFAVVRKVAAEGQLGYIFFAVWLVRALPVEHSLPNQFFDRGQACQSINMAKFTNLLVQVTFTP
jgi:hypothetical protein